MKNFYNKIKISLTALWIAIISFSSKVFGTDWTMDFQTKYWIVDPSEILTEPDPKLTSVIKIAQRLLAFVIFIVWIINLVKIRKIDDNAIKKKKIKKTIVAISILTIIFVALLVFTPSLIEYFS